MKLLAVLIWALLPAAPVFSQQGLWSDPVVSGDAVKWFQLVESESEVRRCLGLVVMPALVWIVGSWKLGPYANGGPFALWRDYLLALFHGSVPYWLVALGPYFGLWLLRAARIAVHR